MGSVYAQKGSSSGGSVYASKGGTVGGAKSAAGKSGHGVGGFLSNLGSDTENFVSGLGPGVAKLGGDVGKEWWHNAKILVHAQKDKPGLKDRPLTQDLKAVGKQYGQTYGPLAHGDVNGFLKQLYAHPLQPILDLATVLTGGGALAAKGADIGARIGGEAALASRAARLAESRQITVPGFGAKAAAETGVKGVGGTDRIVTRMAPDNPVVAARMQLTNKGLNALPARTPIVGAVARGTRALARQAGPAAARAGHASAQELSGLSAPFQKAYSKLSLERQAAFHLLANGTLPKELGDYTRGMIAAGHDTSAANLRLLDHPVVQKLVGGLKVGPAGEYVAGDRKLYAALSEGSKLSDTLTHERVTHGLLSETAAAERPYFMQRILNGAQQVKQEDAARAVADINKQHDAALIAHAATLDKHIPSEVDALRRAATGQTLRQLAGGLGGAEIRLSRKAAGTTPAALKASLVEKQLARAANSRALIDQAHQGIHEANQAIGNRIAEASQHGIIDQRGHSIPEIGQRIADRGHPQPFYLPMHSNVNDAAGLPRVGRLKSDPTVAAKNNVRQIEGTLLRNGLLSIQHDPLTPSAGLATRYAQKSDLHDILAQHAVGIPDTAPKPAAWSFLKMKTGEHIAHTDQVRTAFEKNAAHQTDFEVNKDFFTTGDEHDPGILRDGGGHRLIVPTQAVKGLMEETRNTHALVHALYTVPTNVWKHLVLGLRPGFGVNLTIGNHVLGAMGSPSFIRFAVSYLRTLPKGKFDELLGAKISDGTLQRIMPNQRYGSFGHSEGFDKPLPAGAHGARRVAHRLSQGVMPPTIAVENFLRKALVDSWARSSPQVRVAFRANGGDINAALETTFQKYPHVIQEIDRRTDAALGNYRSYSALEKGVKGAVPFYGWLRHITQATGRTLSETPYRAGLARPVGQFGHDTQQNQLGDVPSFMQGGIGLGHMPGFLGGGAPGRTPVLSTTGWNPYNSMVDVGKLALALGHGGPGQMPANLLESFNPFGQGVIEQETGRSILNGAPVKGYGHGLADVPARVTRETSEARLIAALLGGDKTKPTSLYRHDWRTQLVKYLGLPVNETSLPAARVMAYKEKHPSRRSR